MLPLPPYLMQPMDSGDLYGQWWWWWWGQLGIPPGQSRRNPGRYCSLQGPCAWWGPGREQSLWTWAKRRAQVKPSTKNESLRRKGFCKHHRGLWVTFLCHLSTLPSLTLLLHCLTHCRGWLWPQSQERRRNQDSIPWPKWKAGRNFFLGWFIW